MALIISAIGSFGAGYYLKDPISRINRDPGHPETGYSASETLLRQKLEIEKGKVAELVTTLGQYKDARLEAILEKIGEKPGSLPSPTEAPSTQSELRKDALTVLDSIGLMLTQQQYYDQDLLDRLQSKLTTLSQRDDVTLNTILEKLSGTAGTPLAEVIVAALGGVKDQRVEEAARNLLNVGKSTEQRLAGLDLIVRLESSAPETRAAVESILSNENDPRLIRSALYALNEAVVGNSESRAVMQSVSKHLASADPEIRRRAVIATAQWAPDAATITPVVTALSDSDPNVRAGAAYALGISKIKTDGSKTVLINAIKSPQEDWSVKELAWRSLSQYPLDDKDMDAYSAFSRQYENMQEAKASVPERPHSPNLE